MIDLQEIEAIKRLKYRYMRCLDQKLWDEIATCFTDDVVTSYGDGQYSFEGRDAILEFLKGAMGDPTFHSFHQVHQPEIDILSPTEARGVWALQDVVIDTKNEVTIRGAAFYEDEYRKVDGEWKIRRTGYKRLFEELQPRADVKGLRLTASWWGQARR